MFVVIASSLNSWSLRLALSLFPTSFSVLAEIFRDADGSNGTCSSGS